MPDTSAAGGLPGARAPDGETTSVPAPATPLALIGNVFRRIASGLDWLFGLLSLVVGLAVISIVPVLNFLSLGYLLHASGRVAVTGRLRNGFPGIRKASVSGALVAGFWIAFLPVRLVSDFWKDAELIAPGSARSRAWYIGLLILTVLTVLHVIWACLRGGRLWHFLWPAPVRLIRWFSSPDTSANTFRTARNAVVDYLAGLRLPYLFWLGLRGCLGALIWLAAPVGLLILASALPPGGGALLSLVGGFLLMLVVLHLPFLQANFATTGQFRSLLALGQVRQLFKRAPIAFGLALLITLLFALPLYLLKIELPPREVAWMPSLLFILSIYPARLLAGWALGRARRREQPSHVLLRLFSRFTLIPVVLLYVLFVYLTQYLSWNGTLSLLEQHAFMVPAPLMNL